MIPELPEEEDLQPLAAVFCRAVGLPEEDAHPSSIARLAPYIADAYKAIFETYGVPTPPDD